MLTFRLHPIVLTADIKQMYRCIKLDPRDSPYQQILWRFSPSDPVQQFEIQRVCFGVACAPYQALRVIKQLIQDEGHRFPLAAQALDSDTYIDDICTGASSVEEVFRRVCSVSMHVLVSVSIRDAYASIVRSRSLLSYPTMFHSLCTSRPKLPQINIPVFDGTHESFSSFKSLFDALVHSQVGLTPIEKYSYLKSLLSGPALACIQGFSFSENNYQIAYQTLVNQFSNKRVVANSICAKLFSIKPLTHEAQLRSFLETFNVSVEAFKAVGINNQGDFLLLFMALRILDPTTRQAFENMWVEKEVVPQYKDLLKFVQGRVSVSDLMSPVVAKPAPTRSTPQASGYKAPPPATVKRSFVANVVSPKPTSEAKPVRDCPCCNQAHKLIVCNQFQRLSIPERYNFLREKQLCFACFGPHSRNLCTTRFSCRQCQSKKHHTLLHSAQPTGPADASPAYSTYPVQPNTSNSLTNVNPGPSGVVNPSTTLSCNLVPDAHKPSYVKQVLLGTAVVSVPDAFGRRHDIRILIDPGSMINIVTQSLANRLCLPSQPSQVSISGIGSGTPQTVTGVLSCTLESKHCPFALNVEAAILPRISANIPALPVSPDIIRQFANVELADPSFFQPSSVHMLLGAQHYADIIRSHEPIIRGEPSLVPSNFGVLVMGCAPAEPVFPAVQQSFFITNMENDLSNQLKRFWEMEEICVKPATNPEDDECEQHFIKTHRREPSGTYVVRLPFRNNQPPDLGNNRSQALNRLLKLERQLDRNPTFRELYHENIKDYLDVGHMIPASKPSDYLLIHHGVLKESSSTTKCRVVFSPAEHASPSHPSLNEALLVGPKLQNDITDIMLTFRLHPIVLTADIKQMYRCIKLDPRDSPYQQILWRFSPSDPVQQFEIQRVCFGVACAPYQALRVIKQLIQDEGHRFPLAAQALDSDTYIDDICTGASSVEEAGRLRDELVSLLATAGFELRKWSCSDPTVLRDLPLNYLEKPHQLGDIETIRVLGLQWDPHQDAFIYRVDPIENCVTKRQVLSQIARIYDLSGFGAARVLDETYTFLKRNEPAIIDHLTGREIQWTFNAPSNPSSGGLWEAGVKSVKHHLKRILNDRPLHYEEFLTLPRSDRSTPELPTDRSSRFMSCGRCSMFDPGHFLIGAPLVARPETNLTDVPSIVSLAGTYISSDPTLVETMGNRVPPHLDSTSEVVLPSDNLKVGGHCGLDD
ncbi:uncharacterized protein LOC103520254 [Diaphorina citri]|uniref:Uncharacterized protein LOC103520254 n=1 Tax=Diaphorina citri TaxID=121845 RepID=A0A1S3DK52_DIACI|nr:uncharacterized protein LOC103520254 [Diaphorina citri]